MKLDVNGNKVNIKLHYVILQNDEEFTKIPLSVDLKF